MNKELLQMALISETKIKEINNAIVYCSAVVLTQLATKSKREHSLDKLQEVSKIIKSLKVSKPISWQYDFYSDGELVKDWTTNSLKHLPETACNIRPLYTGNQP